MCTECGDTPKSLKISSNTRLANYLIIEHNKKTAKLPNNSFLTFLLIFVGGDCVAHGARYLASDGLKHTLKTLFLEFVFLALTYQ